VELTSDSSFDSTAVQKPSGQPKLQTSVTLSMSSDGSDASSGKESEEEYDEKSDEEYNKESDEDYDNDVHEVRGSSQQSSNCNSISE